MTETRSLDDMGFETMTEKMCRDSGSSSPLRRCVIVVTEKCNFACPYCKSHNGKNMPKEKIKKIIQSWADDNLYSIHFTGGEPTVHKDIVELVQFAKDQGIERAGLATNGSADIRLYKKLYKAGIDDFSISLDADNPEDAEVMSGRSRKIWEKTVSNIKEISTFARVTAGLVINELNIDRINEIILFTLNLGVDDIRLNPAAQYSSFLPEINLGREIIKKYPNLNWRIENSRKGIGVRGLDSDSAEKCYLVRDEMTVNGDYHYPCFIYMREGGKPIGRWNKNARKDRENWVNNHNPKNDPICMKNCADCCSLFNSRYEENNQKTFSWKGLTITA